jgi:ATP-dependent helicase/nuclease subunit B
MKFIEQLTAYIEEHLDPRHLTIVLPSERAKKYIGASWYNRFKKPVWLPEMITIDQLVRQHARHPIIDRTRALIELYAIHCELDQSNEPQSFDDFLSWGGLLLNDFDEIERYQVKPKDLFRNLTDIKEIENWSFNNEKLTEQQKKFMEFWEKLPTYFFALSSKLEDKGMMQAGRAYRELAESPEVLFKLDKNRNYLFAGFNALSKSELELFKQLHNLGRGHIIIDADAYYLHSATHEAGSFIRKLVEELHVKSLPFVSNGLTQRSKTINTIECPQHTGQVKAIASLLNKLSEHELNETMVLLADESLIAPLLKNIPKNVGTANVTLGLPLQYTALKTWIENIFGIQESKLRYKSEAFYTHDLRKIWRHPFVLELLTETEKKRFIGHEQRIINKNILFVNPETVACGNAHDTLLELLRTPWKGDWGLAIKSIRQLNHFVHERIPHSSVYDRAILQRFDEVIRDFQHLVEEGLPTISLKTFKHLFHQHWSGKALAFHGTPLKGLQIMGLLETRLLDFKRIYAIGMNEGKMPPTNPVQTMIPMDLRAYFGLPTPREKQGLFAHHFYRLLHECDEMWVTYTTAKENIGSNEASRYLKQLELELCRENEGVVMHKWLYSIPTSDSGYGMVEIQKTDEVFSRINTFLNGSLSASKVNKYFSCPLEFYYRYILDFGEEEVIEEEIENNRFGIFIHEVLEQLFRNFARHDKEGNKVTPSPKNVTIADIDHMLEIYPNLIEEQFTRHFHGDRSAFDSGKNVLSFQMALELTRRILLKEREFIAQLNVPLFIEYIEFTMEAELEIQHEGKPRKIRLKGIADRIDSFGNEFRVIDYKSGKAKKSEVTLDERKADQDIVSYISATKHALQLLMYMYLFRSIKGFLPSQASIYSMVSIEEGPLPLCIKNDGLLQDVVDELPAFFEQFVHELLNQNAALRHNPESKYCSFCE